MRRSGHVRVRLYEYVVGVEINFRWKQRERERERERERISLDFKELGSPILWGVEILCFEVFLAFLQRKLPMTFRKPHKANAHTWPGTH